MKNQDERQPKIDEVEQKGKKSQWIRVPYMLLYVAIGYFISAIVFCIAIVQFIYTLINKTPNQKLIAFSRNFAIYAKEIIEYLSYNSEEKPWPIGDYPQK